jgi:hypothetical protein
MSVSKKYAEYKNNRKKLIFKYLDDNIKSESLNICIIVPHRNRIDHLKKFINHFTDYHFDIYIIDQNNADKFNRGLLLNIGYIIAKTKGKYDRFIFHDVDSYPDETLLALYNKYNNYNIHFACNDYKYSFPEFLGGVIGFTKNDFEKINGFPNTFFGWGGEDDSMYNRCVTNNIDIYRPSKGKYLLEEHAGPTKQEYNVNKQINILNDLKYWYSNGVKQILNFYINYKSYPNLNDFINSLDLSKTSDFNLTGSKMITDLDNTKCKLYFYKIDYLATHTNMFSKIENKNIINESIQKKIEFYKKNNLKYYQHKKEPVIISVIEPLIYWSEIKEKIINTFTTPNEFKLSKKDKNNIIEKLVKTHFKSYKKNLTKNDLENTLKLVYDNYRELIYVRIRNNKIDCSYNIYNLESKIDWYKYLKYKNQNLDNSLLELMNDRGIKYTTLKKPHFIYANNCLLSFEAYNYQEGNPTSYIQEFMDMIEYTINKFKTVPDCDFLLNRKDFAYLRKDNKSAYDHLNTDKITDLTKIWPLGSQSKKDIHLDIPFPSADEWKALNDNINDISWSNKVSTALFRGSSTGCGYTIDTNPRMKLADISYKWNKESDKKNLINAGISRFIIRITAYDKIIGFTINDKYKHLVGEFIDSKDQTKYKYIFNIEGNAAAYRYPSEFKKKSVILNVKSKCQMWFEPLLENKKNFIEIDSDYKNLYETMMWLKDNDNKAEDIAKNGYKLYEKYLTKDGISDYWFYFMYYINLHTI